MVSQRLITKRGENASPYIDYRRCLRNGGVRNFYDGSNGRLACNNLTNNMRSHNLSGTTGLMIIASVIVLLSESAVHAGYRHWGRFHLPYGPC